MIIQKNGSQLDGLLFLVRHLMILKDVGKNSDLTLGVGHGDSKGSGIVWGASGSAAEAVGLGITGTWWPFSPTILIHYPQIHSLLC